MKAQLPTLSNAPQLDQLIQNNKLVLSLDATIELALQNKHPTEEAFASVAATLCDELEPIADDIYSADFKRHVASVILRRTVGQAYQRAVENKGG